MGSGFCLTLLQNVSYVYFVSKLQEKSKHLQSYNDSNNYRCHMKIV